MRCNAEYLKLVESGWNHFLLQDAKSGRFYDPSIYRSYYNPSRRRWLPNSKKNGARPIDMTNVPENLLKDLEEYNP